MIWSGRRRRLRKYSQFLIPSLRSQFRLPSSQTRLSSGSGIVRSGLPVEEKRGRGNDVSVRKQKTNDGINSSLKTKASKKHTKEYAKARARYPSPDMY